MRTARADVRRAVEALEARSLLASVPAGFTIEQVATGLSNPTAMEFAPDGRIFVTQQGGALRVIKNGVLQATPFLSLSVDSSGERGLLGIAFDPGFTTNRRLYVYHTVPGSPAHNRVTMFTADAANPDVASSTSAPVPILDLPNLSSATNHNGGAIHFGPDGKLYVAVGENATPSNAQSLNTRLGKMLRINADGSTPSDNPFFNDTSVSGVNKQIWALGLRNPFTFSFQPGTGKLHINDVGQSTWEEINVGQPAANYGWPTIEGKRTTQTPPANYVDPISVYQHPFSGSNPNDVGIAITGGTFYQRPEIPVAPFPDAYNGDYFYADFGTSNAGNWIRSLDGTTSSLFLTGASNIVDLRTGSDGNLYYLERGNGGSLSRVRNTLAIPGRLDLVAASDSGVSNSDNITNDNTPTIQLLAGSGTEQRIYVDGVLAATQTATGTFQVTLPTLSDGSHTITAISATAAGAVSASSQPMTITIDTVAPTVTATYDFETAQRIHLAFNEAVNLSSSSLSLSPNAPLAYTLLSSPGQPTVAEYTSTTLADATYSASFATAPTDSAGNAVAGPLNLTFSVLAADATRDGQVNFDDLVALAASYGQSGKTFSQGDFNYDGAVNFDDLVILARHYGNTAALSAPIAVLPAADQPARRQRARDRVIE